MSGKPRPEGVVQIKKYPNRRFYDAAGRRHLTLGDIHAVICEGADVEISDSQTGEDITHQVLTQIILERDAPKLSLFVPANILHRVIRTQNQMLGGVVEDYFRQMLSAHRASQERWSAFLRNTLGFGAPMPASPVEWAKWFMPGIGAGPATTDSQAAEAGAAESTDEADESGRNSRPKRRGANAEPSGKDVETDGRAASSKSENSTIDELRRKIEVLERRMSHGVRRSKRKMHKPR